MGDDDDDVVYPAGLRGSITNGPFAGFAATIVVDRWRLDVEISIFGRTLQVTIERTEFLADGAAPPTDAARMRLCVGEHVKRALEAEAFYADVLGWWLPLVDRKIDDTEAAAAWPRFLAHERAVEESTQAKVAEAIAAFELDPTSGAAWVTRAIEAGRHRGGLDNDSLKAAAQLRDHARDAARLGNTDPLAGTAPIAENAALVAEIEANPESPAPYLVYGDWLQTQGDPRGELVALCAAGDAAAIYTHVLRHERYLLGGLDTENGAVEVTWDHGWLRAARIQVKRRHERANIAQAPLIACLMGLPSARFLRELVIGCASLHEDEVKGQCLTALVAAGARPTLRSLQFVTDEEEEMLSWTSTGPLGRLWPLYPNLRALRVEAGSIDLGDFAIGTLEDLEIRTCGLTEASLRSVVDAPLDRCTRFHLWFGQTDRGATDSRGALQVIERVAPNATDFGLCNTQHTEELVAALVHSPRWATIEKLDLTDGTMYDAGAEILAGALANAKRLVRLDVSTNYLSAEAVASLARPGLEVVSTWQRDIETPEPPDERYVGTYE